jgi:hypothetical protein
MNDIFILEKSKNPKKKYSVRFLNDTGRQKTINFGQKGYTDFLLSGDMNKLKAYTARHSKMGENWTNPKSGAGFWAKNILWNPYANTLDEAIRQVENSFDIKIVKNL